MANRTVTDAKSVRGTNPQYLVEKITRTRIYECKFWKEECFALSAELLVDKAMDLNHIGGTFGGNIKPTPFLCLTLKMLQIQPEKDILVEFIKNEDYKYVRALGAFYMRLIGTSLDCYKYLEPLYNDYRKMKNKDKATGQYKVTHMDEFIDDLLREERVCDILLPRIQKRYILEELEEIEPRVSALEDDMDELESEDEEMKEDTPSPVRHRSMTPEKKKRRSRSRSPERRRRSSRSPSPPRRSRRSPSPRHHRHRSRSRSRSPRQRRHRSRSRSRSPKRTSRR